MKALLMDWEHSPSSGTGLLVHPQVSIIKLRKNCPYYAAARFHVTETDSGYLMQRGNLLEGMELFVGYKGGGKNMGCTDVCVGGCEKRV